MNKAIGTTTIGTLILAGLIFQARNAGGPKTEQVSSNTPTPLANAPPSGGPWIASCKYWSAARTVISPESGQPAPFTCGPDSWGIPRSGPDRAEISAIIATVPDPIHSHLALDFDRSIDAILLAAADNHYLSSYYWLPWRSRIGSTGQLASNIAGSASAYSARERQPGLIILHYTPDASEWGRPDSARLSSRDYRRVIYLFLVAETPSLGVNGNQLQNAFYYEKALKHQGARLSVGSWPSISPAQRPGRSANEAKHPRGDKTKRLSNPAKPCPAGNDQLSIIGPIYSGSAASLHAGIEASLPGLCAPRVSITGVTGTVIAKQELDPDDKHIYHSFGENASFEENRFLQSIAAAGYDLSRVAVLAEAGTVFGAVKVDLKKEGTILYLRFPRELSLLRNAEQNQSAAAESGATPTPYLNLSLKDNSADDTVPRFSTNQSPLSLEAQLMGIAHQLQRARSQFIVISASNILDVIFLSQFLHRACPDARLVILNGEDLLFERDANNAPYIGSIAISPYLLSTLDFGNRTQWLHADYEAEGIYNAASFTFWNGAPDRPPVLAGYRSYPVPGPRGDPDPSRFAVQFQQIPLWATTVGADGYYPLAVLNWCGSDFPAILPTISLKTGEPQTELCSESKTTNPAPGAPGGQHVWDYVPESINENSGISPSLLWGILAGFISLASIAHCVLLLSADFWSPFTRDLAIDHNDLPYRRAIHINIGTSVLTAIAFVTGYPLLRIGHYYHLARGSYPLAALLLGAAGLAVVCTALKTWPYRYHPKQRLYCFFNLVSVAALVGTIAFWTLICGSDTRNGHYTYAGLFFCYRCIRPLNGVCPLLPILLLLFAWYLWSIYQTARLRFSEIHRPRIARQSTHAGKYLPRDNAYPLFVPDNTLEGCTRFSDNCLYQNITCLLISREVLVRLCAKLQFESAARVRKLATWIQRHINQVLGCIYIVLFWLCIFASHVHALDHFLFSPVLFTSGPTLYEFLIAALFFPLIMVVLSGWLRVILIWGAISRGLLEPLERMPVRFAFSRFNGGGWFSMLRQKGLHIRWRDMARTTESIRQIVHHPDHSKNAALYAKLLEQYERINVRIYELMESIKGVGAAPQAPLAPSATTPLSPATASTPLSPAGSDDSFNAVAMRAKQSEDACPSDRLWDMPRNSAELCKIYHIEEGYACFCRILIEDLLADYWDKKRIGLVEDIGDEGAKSEASKQQESGEPSLSQIAEELIVLRYVALIRAVLINIRYLMLFVTTAFVLALVGWNSYPFQPHAFIDWCFTILLGILTFGFVSVLAQMHRNAILSRVTNTTANELGWEFYARIFAFGAVPVLTWLAYQFPEIGGTIYRIIQPGLQVVK
jgi:hypothetical protein